MEEPLEKEEEDDEQELDDGGVFCDSEPEAPNPADDFILVLELVPDIWEPPEPELIGDLALEEGGVPGIGFIGEASLSEPPGGLE